MVTDPQWCFCCCDACACSSRADKAVPWGVFLRSRPVWAIIVAHFCYNWGMASGSIRQCMHCMHQNLPNSLGGTACSLNVLEGYFLREACM